MSMNRKFKSLILGGVFICMPLQSVTTVFASSKTTDDVAFKHPFLYLVKEDPDEDDGEDTLPTLNETIQNLLSETFPGYSNWKVVRKFTPGCCSNRVMECIGEAKNYTLLSALLDIKDTVSCVLKLAASEEDFIPEQRAAAAYKKLKEEKKQTKLPNPYLSKLAPPLNCKKVTENGETFYYIVSKLAPNNPNYAHGKWCYKHKNDQITEVSETAGEGVFVPITKTVQVELRNGKRKSRDLTHYRILHTLDEVKEKYKKMVLGRLDTMLEGISNGLIQTDPLFGNWCRDRHCNEKLIDFGFVEIVDPKNLSKRCESDSRGGNPCKHTVSKLLAGIKDITVTLCKEFTSVSGACLQNIAPKYWVWARYQHAVIDSFSRSLKFSENYSFENARNDIENFKELFKKIYNLSYSDQGAEEYLDKDGKKFMRECTKALQNEFDVWKDYSDCKCRKNPNNLCERCYSNKLQLDWAKAFIEKLKTNNNGV